MARLWCRVDSGVGLHAEIDVGDVDVQLADVGDVDVQLVIDTETDDAIGTER